MMKRYQIFKLLFLLSFIPFACLAPKGSKELTLDELNELKVIKLPLGELLENKALYHGQYIQTEGYFESCFERSALYYNHQVKLGDTIIEVKARPELWVRFNYRISLSSAGLDSLRNRLVEVKGFFDTTGKGHLNYYEAELKNIYSIRPVGMHPQADSLL
ncbi:hypothetical protein [Foetidibacter luteolus]|uniref:hypothetical protein n=1 Tax=Foetidibacter luteolus TaxID=2608880 RepID=UPI00129C01F7|nr:hypothetical protein [Foetidibacter luteolus]